MVWEVIDEYHIDNAYVTITRATEAQFGRSHLISITNTQSINPVEEWSVTRWFYFDEYSESVAREFAKKIVEDDAYREKCLNREADWARTSDIYKQAAADIQRHFEEAGVVINEAEDDSVTMEFDRANKVLYDICERLYKGTKYRITHSNRVDEETTEEFIEARKNEAVLWLQAEGYLPKDD